LNHYILPVILIKIEGTVVVYKAKKELSAGDFEVWGGATLVAVKVALQIEENYAPFYNN